MEECSLEQRAVSLFWFASSFIWPAYRRLEFSTWVPWGRIPLGSSVETAKELLTREWAKSFAVVQLSDSSCAGILQHSCNSSGMQPSPQCVWTFSDLTRVISDCMWPFFFAGKQRFHRCWENWNGLPIYLFDAVLHARSPDWAVVWHWIGLSTSRLVLGECQECCHSKMLEGFGLHHLLTADFLIDCRSWRSERARVALCASFLIRISQFALFPTNHRSCCRIGFHISLL